MVRSSSESLSADVVAEPMNLRHPRASFVWMLMLSRQGERSEATLERRAWIRRNARYPEPGAIGLAERIGPRLFPKARPSHSAGGCWRARKTARECCTEHVLSMTTKQRAVTQAPTAG